MKKVLKNIKRTMSREQVMHQVVAMRTMEYNAAMAAKTITSQTESKITRANYEHYQGHYKVC